jgi:hypothetical protein
MRIRNAVRWALAGALALGATSLLAPEGARADPPPACRAWTIQYGLAANLQVTDTPLGEGDGVYKVGPGQVTLRFDDVGGQPGGDVQMLAYHLHEHFIVKAKTLLWTTTVTTDTHTTASPRASGFITHGQLVDHKLTWSEPLHAYRSDGTLDCDGSLCGKFGAPPAGKSQLHIPPHDVTFKAFKFSSKLDTFTMQYSLVSKSASPKQTTHLALAGRATSRACIAK